ncbi:MAG: OmpH family outer membrane protein [Bacteroidota bacterium]
MKKFVMFLACGLLIGNVVFAQTALKIGYINSAVLLQSMPEKTAADSAVSKYARSFQDQIEIMMKEYQTKGQTFQASEKTMTEAMKEVKIKEIQDLQNRIEGIQQSAQEKIQTKKQDVYAPILEKAEKAIKAVAKEKNYDYVLDQQGGVLLFGKDEYDITPLVKAKLGIK